MKKVTACLLAFLVSISLLGCGTAPAETRKNNERRTEDSGRNSDTKPGGKETENSTTPSGSGDGLVIYVTWANWKDFIEFYMVEDRSKANPSVKMVDYTFGVRAKEGYELKKLSVKLDATLYYRCGNADMKEHLEKDIEVSMDEPTYTIRFYADDLINYNGRIVESVYYDDIITITGRVVKK